MDVLLVVPRFNTSESFIPIGTAYINAVIRKGSWSADAINLNYRSVDELKEKLSQCKILLCGGVITDLEKLSAIFRFAREINPEIIIIGGGAGYSSSPILFTSMTGADYAVIGEGEKVTFQLIDALLNGHDVLDIRGIVYHSNGECIYTGKADIIQDMDTIPFPCYDDLDIEEYFEHQISNRMKHIYEKNYFLFKYKQFEKPRELPMMLSRSCPYLCSFCFHTLGNKYRMRSLDSFFAELDLLIEKYHINGIYLIDELFGLNDRIISEFCERISRYNLKWFAEIRIETATKETLQKMKDAGCENIQFGVENICDDVLKNMNKKLKKAQIESALKNAFDVGMIVSGNILLGAENDTWEYFLLNYDWWNNNRRYCISMINIIQFPGSAYFERCIKNGYILDAQDYIRKGSPPINMSRMSDYEWDKMNRMVLLSRKNKSFQGKIRELKKYGNGCFFAEIECVFCGKYYNLLLPAEQDGTVQELVESCEHCGRRNVYNLSDYSHDFQFELQKQWIMNTIHGFDSAQWLEQEKIHSFILWWNNDMGELLYNAYSKDKRFEMIQVVDRTENRDLHLFYKDACFTDEKSFLQSDADCLVVCESSEFISERRKLRELGYKGRIISAADIIFGHAFYISD